VIMLCVEKLNLHNNSRFKTCWPWGTTYFQTHVSINYLYVRSTKCIQCTNSWKILSDCWHLINIKLITGILKSVGLFEFGFTTTVFCFKTESQLFILFVSDSSYK